MKWFDLYDKNGCTLTLKQLNIILSNKHYEVDLICNKYRHEKFIKSDLKYFNNSICTIVTKKNEFTGIVAKHPTKSNRLILKLDSGNISIEFKDIISIRENNISETNFHTKSNKTFLELYEQFK
jgi:hypothetical protein